MFKITKKKEFAAGLVLGVLLGGVVIALAAPGIYVPQSGGDWIRDPAVYQPGTDDQINVLADIQPGGAFQMMEVGLRFNALNLAGKKKNWGFAAHESHELEEAMDKLGVTRPALKVSLEAFIVNDLVAVNNAITAQDKAQFKAAMKAVTAACNACHVSFGKSYLEVKTGKSAFPIR